MADLSCILQLTLAIKDDKRLPEGFEYFPDFLSEAEERELLAAIANVEFHEFAMKGVTAKRRVAQFGWHYSFQSFHISPADPPPKAFEPVRARVAAVARVEPEALSEVLVTEYKQGAGIGWHRDAPPFGIVAGISLGSPCRMRFRTASEENRQTVAVQLDPRSLYLLTGSARTDWHHTIPPTKQLRYSITFRTLRRPT
jgi:alkylated DNA repair protein (DNA oxidative demethylase)